MQQRQIDPHQRPSRANRSPSSPTSPARPPTPCRKPSSCGDLGACVLTDTPGFDDAQEELGDAASRPRAARSTAPTSRVLLLDEAPHAATEAWLGHLRERNIPVVGVLSRADLLSDPGRPPPHASETLRPAARGGVVATQGSGLAELRETLVRALPDDTPREITAGLAAAGDTVLLVMPPGCGRHPKGA